MSQATHRLFANLFTIIICLLPAISQAASASPQARLLADARNRPAEHLQNLEWATATLIDGRELTIIKALDAQTGEVLREAFHNGHRVDEHRFRAESDGAWRALHGALSPRMVERMEQTSSSERVSIDITYAFEIPEDHAPCTHRESGADEGPCDARASRVIHLPTPRSEADAPSVDETAQQMKARELAIEKALAGPRSRVLERLEASDATILHASRITPTIVAEVNPSTLWAAARWPEVTLVDDPTGSFGPQLDNSARTSNARTLFAEPMGYTGQGTTVAVIEGGRVFPNNPHMTVHKTWNTSRTNYDHATRVAGIIASKHSTYRGVAPGVTLLSANAVDNSSMAGERIEDAIDWAVSEDAHILHLSWGHELQIDNAFHPLDRKLDWIARYHKRSVIVSAGNQGASGCSGATQTYGVSTPGRGFNVLTVGASDDKGTLTWNDDTVWNCSADGFPVGDATLSGPHRKPEVYAPGVDIRSLAASMSQPLSSTDGRGTSYAAPVASGIAALLMEADPTLRTRPALVRALLGVATPFQIPGPRLARTLNGTAAMNALQQRLIHYPVGGVSSASFPLSVKIDLQKGERIRAQIAWTSNLTGGGSGSAGNDMLPADLDLYVYRENGTVLTSSTGLSNAWETVDFVAPTTGTYTFTTQMSGSWDGSGPTEFAFAAFIGERLLPRNTRFIYSNQPPSLGNFYAIRPNVEYSGSQAQWFGVAADGGASANIALEAWYTSWFDSPTTATDDIGRALRTTSQSTSGVMQFLMIDGNRWLPDSTLHLRVRPISGSGAWAVSSSNTIVVGANDNESRGSFTLQTNQPLFVADVAFAPGSTRTIVLRPGSGADSLASDFGVALFSSTPGTTTYPRGSHVAIANSHGPGQQEVLTFTHTGSSTKRYGLAVYNLTRNRAPSFYLDFPQISGPLFMDGFESSP